MRNRIFKLIDDLVAAIGLRPVVFVVEVPHNKDTPLKVLNVDTNLKCAVKFFESHDPAYADCALVLGFRKAISRPT